MKTRYTSVVAAGLLLMSSHANAAVEGFWNLTSYIKSTVKVGASVQTLAAYDVGKLTLSAPIANKGDIFSENYLGKLAGNYTQTVIVKNRSDSPKITFKGQLNKTQLINSIKLIFTQAFPKELVLANFKVKTDSIDGDELKDSGATDANAKVLFCQQKITVSFTISQAGAGKAAVVVSYDNFLLGVRPQTSATPTAAQALPITEPIFQQTAKTIAELYQQQH